MVHNETELIGIGLYTFSEAAQLTGVNARTIRRWVSGYSYRAEGERRKVSPMLQSKPVELQGDLCVSFLDLIEVRLVQAFRDEGVSWPKLREVYSIAADVVDSDHPFATRQFRTDGRRIFHESSMLSGGTRLENLHLRQFEFQEVVRPSLRGVQFGEKTAKAWYPLHPAKKVIIDPNRAFGQPITDQSGVPTKVLAKAVNVEGSEQAVAKWYNVALEDVSASVEFEERLAA